MEKIVWNEDKFDDELIEQYFLNFVRWLIVVQSVEVFNLKTRDYLLVNNLNEWHVSGLKHKYKNALLEIIAGKVAKPEAYSKYRTIYRRWFFKTDQEDPSRNEKVVGATLAELKARQGSPSYRFIKTSV